jgi:hypothetical protein
MKGDGSSNDLIEFAGDLRTAAQAVAIARLFK